MDYEVFLVARIVDARRSGMTEADAMAEGLARTGGVITSAAAIMIVVFAAFTLGEFLMVKVLGFALAVAVLLDATVVRLAIGPALLRLAGRWNWWPSKMPATDDARREDRRTGGKEDGQTVVVILSEAKDLLLDAPRRAWPPEKV
jgi:RND superfamily putative drug exporter